MAAEKKRTKEVQIWREGNHVIHFSTLLNFHVIEFGKMQFMK